MQKRALSKKPALIISILFKRRGAIGGMAQRFSIVGGALINRGENIELMTTGSLASEFKLPDSKRTYVIDDSGPKLPLMTWVMMFGVLTRLAFGCYRQVHFAGAGGLYKPLIWASRLSRTRLSCTFASRTIDMASYGRSGDKKKWREILDAVDRIDVLNPGHDLHKWSAKISVSPCSFPSKIGALPGSFSRRKNKLVVFCGALESPKNPVLALDIVDRYIHETGDQIDLLLFGKGSLKEVIMRRMSEINATHGREVVRFGQDLSLGEALSAANVFLSLQEIDNYPSQSVMEAMLLGCKIIATDEGDTKQFFPEGESLNFIVDSRDADKFIEPMRKVFSKLTASYTNAEFIRSQHSLQKFLDYFSGFLND